MIKYTWMYLVGLVSYHVDYYVLQTGETHL